MYIILYVYTYINVYQRGLLEELTGEFFLKSQFTNKLTIEDVYRADFENYEQLEFVRPHG